MANSFLSVFWLNQVTGPNIGLFNRINTVFQELDEALEAAKRKEESAFSQFGEQLKKRALELAEDGIIEKRLHWLRMHAIEAVPFNSSEYPALLKETLDPPSVLYVKGRLPRETGLPIAIVGMRNCTSYGEGVAKHFAAELVKAGATVVSGMAAGIDSYAAEGALRVEHAQIPTVAVLGSGIDVVYPTSNARLYDQIVERGAVVSEFLPGTKPYQANFPLRNRVISGLSKGVVVVEAAERSGSTITVNYALDQGRDVFAVPGRITDENSFGTNALIQKGEAKPVFCAADILIEYGVQAEEAIKMTTAPDTSMLPEREKCIVEILIKGNKSADELAEMLSISIAELNSSLTSLRFSGIIKQLPGRVFGI